MKIIIEATPEEIAAFVVGLQGQQSKDAGHGCNEPKQAEERYVAIREPYQRHYSLVKVRGGRD